MNLSLELGLEEDVLMNLMKDKTTIFSHKSFSFSIRIHPAVQTRATSTFTRNAFTTKLNYVAMSYKISLFTESRKCFKFSDETRPRKDKLNKMRTMKRRNGNRKKEHESVGVI